MNTHRGRIKPAPSPARVWQKVQPRIHWWRELHKAGEFGGLHIFLFRNLWRQWASYVRFKQRGDGFFFATIPLIVNRTDDPFLRHLADFYMRRSGDRRGDAEINALIGTTEGYHVLASLPEPDMFAMFMSMHVYLYLHAQLSADLVVDVSRIARDPAHRTDLERDLRHRVGLPIRLDDIRDESAARSDSEIGAIAWDEIYYHGEIAARTLAARASVKDLSATATGLILAAQKERSRQPEDA